MTILVVLLLIVVSYVSCIATCVAGCITGVVEDMRCDIFLFPAINALKPMIVRVIIICITEIMIFTFKHDECAIIFFCICFCGRTAVADYSRAGVNCIYIICYICVLIKNSNFLKTVTTTKCPHFNISYAFGNYYG